MKLLDIINQLSSFDDGSTIYAVQPWNPDSEAIVATEPDNGHIPYRAEKINAKYFLEVFLANEFMEDWLSTLDVISSEEEQCLRLIEYAERDV